MNWGKMTHYAFSGKLLCSLTPINAARQARQCTYLACFSLVCNATFSCSLSARLTFRRSSFVWESSHRFRHASWLRTNSWNSAQQLQTPVTVHWKCMRQPQSFSVPVNMVYCFTLQK